MMRIMLAVALAFSLLGTAEARPPLRHTAAHATVRASDWVKVYARSSAGGIVQGNPQAPVKVVEYFSPTCPHCKHYADDSRAGLAAMVATGKLSYEMRPLLLGQPHEPALDVLIGCGTAAQGAALTDVFFAKQEEIFANIPQVFKANAERWQKIPITAAYNDIADKLSLVAMAQQVGVAPTRAHACLTDKRNYLALQATSQRAEQMHVNQTPSFFLNDAPITTAPTEAPWVGVKRVLDATLPGVAWPPVSSAKPAKKG
jgi:protein-disulfide isomerase